MNKKPIISIMLWIIGGMIIGSFIGAASVRDKLASFKKQSEETKHDKAKPTKRRGMDIE